MAEWMPPSSPREIASGALPWLDLRPFLPSRSSEETKEPSQVREECLRAYEDALLKHLAKKGVRVEKMPGARRP